MSRAFTTKQNGFTLIEVLIYIAIVSLLLTLIINLFFSMGRARMRQQAILEVEQQGYVTLTRLLQTVRNAQSISAPVPGTSASELVVTTHIPTTSPTLFTTTSSNMYVIEGLYPAVPLTNERVLVTNVSFKNLTSSSTNGSVRVQFTVSYATSSGRFEDNYSTTFYGTASVRNMQ